MGKLQWKYGESCGPCDDGYKGNGYPAQNRKQYPWDTHQDLQATFEDNRQIQQAQRQAQIQQGAPGTPRTEQRYQEVMIQQGNQPYIVAHEGCMDSCAVQCLEVLFIGLALILYASCKC